MDTIVVIRLGRLGDVTLTSPTIKNLRFLYPGSRILFVTREQYTSLAYNIPGVTDVLIFPDKGSYFDLVKLSSEIDEYEPNLVVDLHKNFRSFHLAKMSKAPYKVVYKKRRKQRQAAVNEKKFVSPVPHTTDLYNRVIDQLKGQKLARRPDLLLSDKIMTNPNAKRAGVAMVPGASSPVKAWPIENFAELAERIIYDFKRNIILFVGPDDGEMQNYFNHLPEESITVHVDYPLGEIGEALSKCQLTITNDSGLMHVSSAVGTPTAAIFGPTHEQLGFYPLGLHDLVLAGAETCRPCSLHGDELCHREEQYCFTQLTVASIYDKIAQMLDRIKLQPAVFIDRDGTLIDDKHYLADPNKIEFLPGSLEAVKKLKKAGFKTVVISNQSGIARGFFPIETVDLVHNHLRQYMKDAGCEPDDIRFCPHHTDGDVPQYTGECDCRKPRVGMLEEAAANLGIDIKRSFVVGDKYTDVQCGKVAGASSILVRTGNGARTEKELPLDTFLKPYHIADNLSETVDFIVSKR
jgi:histidinol-phosphate phosphatase family protein